MSQAEQTLEAGPQDEFTFTAELPAWLPSHTRIDTLLRAIREGKFNEAANLLSFYDGGMDSGSDPWTRAGTASITVTLRSRNELVQGQLAALHAELQHERAESVQRQNAILDRISKLSALEFSTAGSHQ